MCSVRRPGLGVPQVYVKLYGLINGVGGPNSVRRDNSRRCTEGVQQVYGSVRSVRQVYGRVSSLYGRCTAGVRQVSH